jgi:hypothetical protein
MVKEIPLTRGLVALVDDDDYELLVQYKWYAAKIRKRFYATRDTWENGKKGIPIRMHRDILGLVPRDGKVGDHKNRNTLDNQKGNLRIVSYSLNNHNAALRKNNPSGYRGVTWYRNRQWRAQIHVPGKTKYLGMYDNLIEAALAYDRAALGRWGNDAILNFPERRTIND